MSKEGLNMNRRLVLKGAGACITLPLLESLGVGQFSSFAQRATGSPFSSTGIPKRLVFLPMGYGVNSENWFPKKFGSDYDLPPLVQPFEELKSDITFLQNLGAARSGNPHGATEHFLSQRRKGSNSTLVSCDYFAADLLGKDTRLDYLSMGRLGRADGHGTLPTYDFDGKPAGAYRDMRTVYKALFGDGSSGKEVYERLVREKSSLDAVYEDAKRLSSQVSSADKDRIDEYFTSIRNIEKRLLKAQQNAEKELPSAPFKVNDLNNGKALVDLVFDMMVVAMQSDSTRVLTYTLPTQNVIGYHPHRMSHKQRGKFVAGNLTHAQKRDLAFSRAVSRFLIKLKNTKEADGNSLLDHSLVAYGTNLRQGHTYGKPPMILAGRGGGGIKQGQNLNLKNKSMSHVWLSMLRHVGADIDEFGSAKGKVINEMGFS